MKKQFHKDIQGIKEASYEVQTGFIMGNMGIITYDIENYKNELYK